MRLANPACFLFCLLKYCFLFSDFYFRFLTHCAELLTDRKNMAFCFLFISIMYVWVYLKHCVWRNWAHMLQCGYGGQMRTYRSWLFCAINPGCSTRCISLQRKKKKPLPTETPYHLLILLFNQSSLLFRKISQRNQDHLHGQAFQPAFLHILFPLRAQLHLWSVFYASRCQFSLSLIPCPSYYFHSLSLSVTNFFFSLCITQRLCFHDTLAQPSTWDSSSLLPQKSIPYFCNIAMRLEVGNGKAFSYILYNLLESKHLLFCFSFVFYFWEKHHCWFDRDYTTVGRVNVS